MSSITLTNQDRLNFVSSLSTLIASGIPIMEAVDSQIEESNGNLLKILKKLKEDLSQGKTISDSLSNSPKAFDPITVNLIAAAEESGNLDVTLKNLAQNIRADMEFLSHVKGALAYPVLIVIVLSAVIILNLFFVIPRVATVFTRLNVAIPLPTKVLFALSIFVTANKIEVVVGLFILVLLTMIIYKTQKQILINVLFSLPGISKLVIEIDLTRLTRSLSLLLKSSIPITDALALCKNIVIKKAIRDTVENSTKLVESGKKLSDGFSRTKAIPTFVVQIIQAGEKSGTLDSSMAELSEQFDSRVTARLKNLTTLIEPVLLLFVGLMVGALMLAIIAPIYKLIGNINPRGQ